MFLQQASHRVRAQSSAARAWKDNAVGGLACFIEPCFEDFGDRFAKRNGALLSSLAEDFDVSACSEPNILASQAGHFGQAQACLQGRQQERVIPATAPGALVWCIQKC